MDHQDVERITRLALKDLGEPNPDLTVTQEAGHPDQWRIDLRGGQGPSLLKIRCGQGTTPQFVREQVFQQYNS